MKFKHQDIIDHIFMVMDTMLFIERRFSFTFENVTLFPREVHVILLVQQEQNINAKGIADRFSVTKGAISQTLKRLVDKGMLHKDKNPEQPKELVITLTPLGQKAASHFSNLQGNLARQYDAYLAKLSQTECQTIDAFLKELNVILKEV